MIMYYDLHCHLDLCKNPDIVVGRARKAGVALMITNGLGPESNRKALELDKRYPEVRAALGLYPNDAIKLSENQLQEELDFIKKERPVAIGEVGLDLHHDKEHLSEMRSVFSRVIEAAEAIKRPLIVHSRKAEQEVLEMLASSKVKACLHCFGGSLKLARAAGDKGYWFSVPASILRSTHFQRLVEEVPLNQILTETDSPWQSPDEHDNEPGNVPVIVKKIAEIHKLGQDECAKLLWINCEEFIS